MGHCCSNKSTISPTPTPLEDKIKPNIQQQPKKKKEAAFAIVATAARCSQEGGFGRFLFRQKKIAMRMKKINEHLYEANNTWIKSVRSHMRESFLERLTEESKASKSLSFLSFPVHECSCLRSDSKGASTSQLPAAIRVARSCPAWMGKDVISCFDEDDSGPPGLFFRQCGGSGNKNNGSGGEMMISKEET
ncbi:hypothetical protein L1887_20800 [Cichorium endivia]|nr:hypothetical protein L1887_20800 [Cichorium endivia]